MPGSQFLKITFFLQMCVRLKVINYVHYKNVSVDDCELSKPLIQSLRFHRSVMTQENLNDFVFIEILAALGWVHLCICNRKLTGLWLALTWFKNKNVIAKILIIKFFINFRLNQDY